MKTFKQLQEEIANVAGPNTTTGPAGRDMPFFDKTFKHKKTTLN